MESEKYRNAYPQQHDARREEFVANGFCQIVREFATCWACTFLRENNGQDHAMTTTTTYQLQHLYTLEQIAN